MCRSPLPLPSHRVPSAVLHKQQSSSRGSHLLSYCICSVRVAWPGPPVRVQLPLPALPSISRQRLVLCSSSVHHRKRRIPRHGVPPAHHGSFCAHLLPRANNPAPVRFRSHSAITPWLQARLAGPCSSPQHHRAGTVGPHVQHICATCLRQPTLCTSDSRRFLARIVLFFVRVSGMNVQLAARAFACCKNSSSLIQLISPVGYLSSQFGGN